MSQRTLKVERLVQQTVASHLVGLLPKPLAPTVTITAVEVSPDLRQATVWVGVLADSDRAETILKELNAVKSELQRAVAATMTTKFVPRLHFRLDTGGAYAQAIDKVIREL